MHLFQPTKRNQSGFSIIEVLLVVLFVAVLAISGLVLYQRHKSISAKNSAATNSTQPQTTTATQPVQPATQYLNIKEWGVKLPLSDSIKDAYYVIPTGISKNADGQPSAVDLGLASLNGSCGTVTPSSTSFNHTLGSIVRTLPTETDPILGKLYSQLEPNGIAIGSYYYGYADAQLKNKSCASAATLQSIDSAFATAAKNIVAATTNQAVTQYLTIKEWGVRAPYTGQDTFSYSLFANNNVAYINSAQLDSEDPTCENGGAGGIARLSPNDARSSSSAPTVAEDAKQNPSAYTIIGRFYYQFVHAQSACGSTTTTGQNQANDAVKALVQNLQAIPN